MQQQQQRQRGRQQQQQQQQQQDGTGSPARAGSLGPAASNGMQTDEEIFALDSGDAEDEQSAHRGCRSRRRAVGADGHDGGEQLRLVLLERACSVAVSCLPAHHGTHRQTCTPAFLLCLQGNALDS
jgi:hypothetical protein